MSQVSEANVKKIPAEMFIMKPPSRSIGAILIDAGRLTPPDAERVMQLQRERGILFGDAALELGIVTTADIEFAMSQQYLYPYLQKGEYLGSKDLIAAYNPFSPHVEALRSLRSQLLLRLFNGGQENKTLAIVSPEKGEGRSFIAANLAIVFAQLGEKTLLIDADMRSPKQHALFSIENRNGLSAILSDRSGKEAIHQVKFLNNLSILPAGPLPPNPQELLERPEFKQMLKQLSAEYNVIIIDTPSGSEYADALTVAVKADAALIVVRKNMSRKSSVRSLIAEMASAEVQVVGTVLNEFDAIQGSK